MNPLDEVRAWYDEAVESAAASGSGTPAEVASAIHAAAWASGSNT